ncbi:MAG TPA: endolytic transglycosylase MltG, partial [Thiothrix sp.]|nr:endolytic transglycosylase MltG [Thiothrix sp.]
LEAQGIISNAILFKALARLNKQAHKIKAGEFKLSADMTSESLLAHFVSGKTLQYQFSLIEGHTYKSLIKKIKQSPSLIQTLSDEDYASIMQKLGSNQANPEGWFYPDTYNFPRNTTDVEFLKRAHSNMQDLLAEEWQKREPNPHIKTPYEALILASIVEKETGIAEERPLIAGVFLNRLAKGMKLQTDPTVIYGMGERYEGNIRKADLKRDTPYNTYTRTGLPPTPIATPSVEAIRAVLHPQTTEALYFVAKGGGAHHFSKTYAEHRQAVVKYLLNGNARRYQGDS